MFRLNVKLLNQFKLPKFSIKNYCQVYDNIVKFSNDLNIREIKIPFEGNTYSVFYKKEDKIENVVNVIKGTIDELQKVEILSLNNEIIDSRETLFQEFIQTPFNMRINGHKVVKYFPSLNSSINANPSACTNGLNCFSSYILAIAERVNSLEDKNEIKRIIEEKKLDDDFKLNSLLQIYEKIYAEYEKEEEYIETKFKSRIKSISNLALLFFIVHAILFYYLIYHKFGWDTMEPITYIVGNVYWIVGLSFFIFKKRKLDLNFIFADTYKKEFFSKIGRRIGYSKVEKDFLINEIKEIKNFKATLSKF